jgi:hypothetical protein
LNVDTPLDELRRQLRALGYLDAGVNRFVLGPARGSRSRTAIAFLASLRVGVVAAILLGPAAAIGVGGRLPGLITGPRDALVIAIYIGALFGAAISSAAFTASLGVASMAGDRLARRASALSRGAGGLVAIGCLAYLTLWWRTADAAFGWSAPLATALALAVAVAISLLIGHAVTATAFAVIIAGPTRRDEHQLERPAMPRRWWRTSAAAGVLAFAGAATLLVITAPRDSRVQAAPLTVISSGLRVRLVAIDGFDPAIFADLAATGRVPALAAALSSARARLAPEDLASRDPARTWTTIATGHDASTHGIRGLETRRVAGVQGAVATTPSKLGAAIRDATDILRLTRPSVVTGTERRVKTLWEVAADAGLRTAVVNWWATWPAPSEMGRDGGIVLSDRAVLRLERGGTLDAEIAPASLYERLQPEWPALREEAATQVRRLWPSSGTAPTASVEHGRNPDARGQAIEPPRDSTDAILERSARLDAIQIILAREASNPAPDLLAVYLPGLDVAQHALFGSAVAALPASTVASRVEALREYYMFLDRLLSGPLQARSHELVVIVTEPGRVETAAEGLMGVDGDAAGARTIAARQADVMPTVLHALGIPISRELAGAVSTELFTPDFLRRYPLRQVASYGRPVPNNRLTRGQALDSETIDRLRSLGYVR